YEAPKVRLPGAGGAPEIAAHCREVFVVMEHNSRALVPKVDFVTSLGFGPSGTEREKLGITTKGPTLVVTDLALLQPEPGSNELVVTSLHPGVTSLHPGVTTEEIRAKTGWPVRFSPDLGQTPAPTDTELTVLRELQERTNRAHQKAADG
ncbi:MAG TPA: CoA-transferase, partial [Acidimicrobiia bacterium]|nr:CoA-transferase [Acidimicrobiia bacterium]